MEAARTSETLVNVYQTTQHYNPEDSHLRTHRRENIKSYLYKMFEFAMKNNIVLCLPSHSTHYLQPLDRSFFKPLKTYFYQACQNWILINEKRKITRLQFGKLLCRALSRSATTATGFRATGIFPLERSAIPDHAFVLSDSSSCIDRPHDPEQRSTSPQPSRPTSSNDDVQSIMESDDHVNAPPSPNKVLQQVSPIPQIPNATHSRRSKQ
jgi:hypothetical protein